VSPLVVLSTFLASAVEWVEAFTIVLAVGLFRGWRPALAGAALAAVALAAIVVALGAAVNSFPVADAQVVVGVFLLLFGLRWLHKAILRAAGLKALHDEAAEFEETQRKLSTREHWVAVSTAFNGVLLEGVEVVLIVIALGGNALLERGQTPDADTQELNVRRAVDAIAPPVVVQLVLPRDLDLRRRLPPARARGRRPR